MAKLSWAELASKAPLSSPAPPAPPLDRHTPIKELNPGNPRLKVLRRDAHGTQEVVDTVVESIQEDGTTEFSQVLQEWRQWIMSWQGPNVPIARSMVIALDILCRLFFAVTLPRVRFRRDTSIGESEKPAEGVTYTANGRICIDMDPRRIVGETYDAFRARIITVLLYEMIHALPEAYACSGECIVRGCKSEADRLWGKAGHGSAWFKIGCYLHVAAQKHLTELDIRLNPLVDLSVEARGDWFLCDEDFDLLADDMQYEDALEVVEALEEEEIALLNYRYRK